MALVEARVPTYGTSYRLMQQSGISGHGAYGTGAGQGNRVVHTASVTNITGMSTNSTKAHGTTLKVRYTSHSNVPIRQSVKLELVSACWGCYVGVEGPRKRSGWRDCTWPA